MLINKRLLLLHKDISNKDVKSTGIRFNSHGTGAGLGHHYPIYKVDKFNNVPTDTSKSSCQPSNYEYLKKRGFCDIQEPYYGLGTVLDHILCSAYLCSKWGLS